MDVAHLENERSSRDDAVKTGLKQSKATEKILSFKEGTSSIASPNRPHQSDNI